MKDIGIKVIFGDIFKNISIFFLNYWYFLKVGDIYYKNRYGMDNNYRFGIHKYSSLTD